MRGLRFTFPDLTLSLSTFLLLSLGILVIYSSDTQLAFQQLLFGVVGFTSFWFFSSIDLDYLRYYTKPAYIAILVMLIVVLALGVESRGSIRWIPLGPFRLQPSEFAKPVLILALAQFWSTRIPSWENIGKSLLILVPFFGLIFKQPDLGTSLTLLIIWIVTLLGTNISFIKLGGMTLGSLLTLPVAWFLLHDYQKDRIISFLSPTNDPLGVGYNVIQSTIAVGSGEFMGRGLGRGTQSRLQFLPEFRTDFIFASIAEEFGFIGSMLVLALYGFIVIRLLKLAGQTTDRFSCIVVLGVLAMLVFQIAVNIGMNIGILPITGITLPLISYGGSSVVATMISLGFIASIHRLTSYKR